MTEEVKDIVQRIFPHGKYIGEIENSKPNGHGTMTYTTGDKYTGEFVDGKMNGHGTKTYIAGDNYTGEFIDGIKNGHGTMEYASGAKYSGGFKDGKKNGHGTMTFTTGNKYIGEFIDGVMNGHGTMTFTTGDKYTCEFIDGKPNGQGRIEYISGNKYIGEFKNGNPNGQGTKTYTSGHKYIGEFIDGKPNGQGSMNYPSGVKYIGEFKDGDLNGRGKLIYTTGVTIDVEYDKGIRIENTVKNESQEHYLFFDTETNGLPIDWKAPVTDISNWPRLVQIAWILFDETGNEIERNDHIIKPTGFSIPYDASKIHGVTTERANAEGVSLKSALIEFNNLISKSTYLVAHNMSFDAKIVGAEFLRSEMTNSIPSKRKICTMEGTTDYVAIPGSYGNKWPKLSELHQKLFGFDFEEAHNAAADINATAKCFWEAKKLGIL